MRLPAGVSPLLILIGIYVLLKFGVRPPLPANLISFFMMFVLAGALLHLTLDERKMRGFLEFISFRSREALSWDLFRKALLVLFPLFVAYQVYAGEKIRYSPPGELFQPHVTPPQWVVDFKIPEWAQDPARWDPKRVAEGKKIYEDNCLSCHGQNADGQGPAAGAIRYPAAPTNFREPGTIAQLPLAYVYWRVKDGGITDKQFKSAMPGWGEELEDEEIWKVIMYIYDRAGVRPRTWE